VVDFAHILAGEEVHSVEVLRVALDRNITIGLFDINNSLEESTLALLDHLPERMEICREHCGGREYTLAVLALALTIELLPPLGKECKRRIISCEHLHLLAGTVEIVANHSILDRIVLFDGCGGIYRASISSALHHCVNVNTGNRNGKKSYRSKHRVSAADTVRNDEALISHVGRELLECSAALIGGDKNAFNALLNTVLILEEAAHYAECKRRLGRCSGLGYYVYTNILILAQIEYLG